MAHKETLSALESKKLAAETCRSRDELGQLLTRIQLDRFEQSIFSNLHKESEIALEYAYTRAEEAERESYVKISHAILAA